MSLDETTNYIDLFEGENYTFELTDDDYLEFIHATGISLYNFHVGHYKGKEAVKFYMKMKMNKNCQQTQSQSKGINLFIEQFIVELMMGKFNGKKIDEVIIGLKRPWAGKDEAITLSECLLISERIKNNNQSLTHHGFTFPSWNQKMVRELEPCDKELCYDIAKNYSYSASSREDFLKIVADLSGRKIASFDEDSFISEIVKHL